VARRIGFTIAVALMVAAVLAPAAYAASPSEPPAGARTAISAADTVKAVFGCVRGVDIGRETAVVKVDTGDGVRPIEVNYGRALKDRRALTVGYLAGAYLAMGVEMRGIRFARALGGVFARGA